MPLWKPSLTPSSTVSLTNFAFLSRIGVLAFICAGTTGIVTGLPGKATAQDTVPYIPSPPPDVQKVINGIGDLDILKALVPLKITAEQRDKVLPLMKQWVTEAGAAQRKADYDALRALSEPVAKARDAGLAGDMPPAETEAAVLKALNDSEDRLRAARKKAINAIFPALKEALTSTQKDEVEKQVTQMLGGRRPVPAAYAKNPAKAPAGEVQDLALSTYIDRLLLLDRTVVLLGKIKPAADTKEIPPAPVGAAAKEKPESAVGNP